MGVVVALLATAGGFYLWFRAQVSEANQRVTEEVRVALTDRPSSTITSLATTPGSPESPDSPRAMNLLILGADRRPAEEEAEENGRSDTIILVRIDPDRDFLSVLSIPRDLRVEVPGLGLQKINAAYSHGGPALAIRTIEQVTTIDINHYLEVDFEAFRDLTNALGGVYVEVDQRYFNDNWTWEPIDLLPGYQLLGGEDALDFVRFRHDRNGDFGRMERQQRFLSALREQAMDWDLAFKLPRLARALFSNVATDLGANDILELAWWLIHLDGSRIRQLKVVGDTATIRGASYVLYDEEVMAKAVGAFFTPPQAAGTAITAQATPSSAPTTTTVGEPAVSGLQLDVWSANGRAGEAMAAAEWLRSLGATVVLVREAPELLGKTMVQYPSGLSAEARQVAELVDTSAVYRDWSAERITLFLGDDFALPPGFAISLAPEDIPQSQGWHAYARTVPFAVMAPSYLPQGYRFSDLRPGSGIYDIDGEDGGKPALMALYGLFHNGNRTDQYMGITETTWLDAPTASPGRQVIYDGSVYTIVGTSGKVARVWWMADGVLYWVSNTLSYLLSEEELLAVARCMVSIPVG